MTTELMFFRRGMVVNERGNGWLGTRPGLAMVQGFQGSSGLVLMVLGEHDDTKSHLFLNGAPCLNPSLALSSHFTTSALAKPGNTKANIFGFSVTLTTLANLPGINTMGLTMARVDIAANGLVPPHSHPRASEVTICLQGVLLVGFVDSSNRLFTQQLRLGDSFVFPRGVIHYLSNLDSSNPALAISRLNSQNPGVQIAARQTYQIH
ncbi:hypothetical protein CRYUN_Cryun29cG0045000 [Craigia yunnanensis]